MQLQADLQTNDLSELSRCSEQRYWLLLNPDCPEWSRSPATGSAKSLNPATCLEVCLRLSQHRVAAMTPAAQPGWSCPEKNRRKSRLCFDSTPRKSAPRSCF